MYLYHLDVGKGIRRVVKSGRKGQSEDTQSSEGHYIKSKAGEVVSVMVEEDGGGRNSQE